MPLRARSKLVQRAGGGDPPDHLGARLAADRWRAGAGVRRCGRGALPRTLARFGLPARALHQWPFLGPLLRQQPSHRRSRGTVYLLAHLAALAGGAAPAGGAPAGPPAPSAAAAPPRPPP